MHPSKSIKVVSNFMGSPTNGATVTARIDRYGYDDVRINLIAATADVVSNSPSVLKVTESDTTDATNFTAITPLTGGTAGNTSGFFTIPNFVTTGTNNVVLDVDCRGRKRYLLVTVSPRTTMECVLVAELFRAKESPITTTIEGTVLHVHG